MATYFEFNKKPLPERAQREYVNLKTFRTIKNTNKPGMVTFDVSTVKPGSKAFVVGTPEEILQFKAENNLLAAGEECKIPEREVAPIISKYEQEQVCYRGTAGTVIYKQDSQSIHDVPRELLQSLCPFRLVIAGPGVITEVVDGDTIFMGARVELHTLMLPIHETGRKRELKPLAFSLNENMKFDVNIKCRLDGIDFAEHDTVQGILGVKFMEDLFKKLNYKVYFNAREYDKYGRLLVHLFADKERTVSLNSYFVDRVFGDPRIGNFGHFIEKYNGGTKSDYMKNLPKLDAAGQAEWKEYAKTADAEQLLTR